MKKQYIFILFILLLTSKVYSQVNISIDLHDDIYYVLDYAQMKGLCSILQGNKPYAKSQILKAIDEILENKDQLNENEIEILETYKEKSISESKKKNNILHINLENIDDSGKSDAHFNYSASLNTEFSGGLYSDSKYNQYSFDLIIPKIRFEGDLLNNLSYMIEGKLDLAKTPMNYMGSYKIGESWYASSAEENKIRKIKKYVITSYLPYSYEKKWDGAIYPLTNLSSDGLEGWPFEASLSGAITSEIKASILQDRVIIGAGRINRELAAMDLGSSLVLNSTARPFFAGEFQFNLFPYLRYTSITGSLEYPNQTYLLTGIEEDEQKYSWYPDNLENSVDDSYYWQNNFSINMVELDLPWLHFDFGSSAVWPKRLELGYLFPLANYVEYQNHIGDCDNLGLFTDVKLRKIGLGEIWGSFFLDELNGINNNPIIATRDMFAYQVGIKYVLPYLTNAKISFRYTKIEPYCYTHHSINYVPSYNHYVSENYSNNGQSLGYYLDPNSDEFKLNFDWMPNNSIFVNGNYQFIRHGADYGSQQVPGSSIYSEMRTKDRSDLRKYFLHDGAYNWIHILSVSCNKKFNKLPFNFELYGTAGFVYSYYTNIDSELYTPDGNCENVNFKTPYTKVNTEEYPVLCGGVLTIGSKIKF